MGKVFKVTKFDFVIRRDHGFEAGEYELKIKREDDGVAVGQPIHLTLKGDNAVVDRRAIVFAGEKKPKKADDKLADATPQKAAETPAEEKPTGTELDASVGDAPAPPPVPPMQGGCGCRLSSENGSASPFALAGLAVAVALFARRRR
jgi:MYXO-CTERM domain-containing protein